MNQIGLTDEDAAAIGRAFMEKLPEDYCWSECPTEYVTQLRDQIGDCNPTFDSDPDDPNRCTRCGHHIFQHYAPTEPAYCPPAETLSAVTSEKP